MEHEPARSFIHDLQAACRAVSEDKSPVEVDLLHPKRSFYSFSWLACLSEASLLEGTI